MRFVIPILLCCFFLQVHAQRTDHRLQRQVESLIKIFAAILVFTSRT